jgi:putative nucleotidyltransferase with HDIG domain
MTGHILALDDEPSVRAMLSTWLQAEGLRCSGASTPAEAIALFDRDPADVALIDLRLGRDSGLTAARGLRARRDDVAIVLVTGVASFDAAVEAMRLGVLDYLLKPFTRPDLVRMVGRALDWSATQSRLRTERAQFQAEVERRRHELAEAFMRLEVASSATLDVLLKTLDRCSPETFHHARRVAKMAVSLAERVGLSPEDVTDVERGALLHDIGKVAMPDAIINKPGPLSEPEVAIVSSHPQVGHDIVAVVPALANAAEIVLASHERFDGRGYPRKLAGEAIPIGARITAVADVFDVLTAPRAYRDPVSIEQACAELVRCAGTQFDPDIVREWLRVVGDAQVSPSPQPADWRRALAALPAGVVS